MFGVFARESDEILSAPYDTLEEACDDAESIAVLGGVYVSMLTDDQFESLWVDH